MKELWARYQAVCMPDPAPAIRIAQGLLDKSLTQLDWDGGGFDLTLQSDRPDFTLAVLDGLVKPTDVQVSISTPVRHGILWAAEVKSTTPRPRSGACPSRSCDRACFGAG